jgi:hypothetical protein
MTSGIPKSERPAAAANCGRASVLIDRTVTSASVTIPRHIRIWLGSLLVSGRSDHAQPK